LYKAYQLLAHGRWFSPASSTTKTGCHDIAEILLKVVLNTINQSIKSIDPRMLSRDYKSEINSGLPTMANVKPITFYDTN
jgi:uncharacterized protein (DUF39 family)